MKYTVYVFDANVFETYCQCEFVWFLVSVFAIYGMTERVVSLRCFFFIVAGEIEMFIHVSAKLDFESSQLIGFRPNSDLRLGKNVLILSVYSGQKKEFRPLAPR